MERTEFSSVVFRNELFGVVGVVKYCFVRTKCVLWVTSESKVMLTVVVVNQCNINYVKTLDGIYTVMLALRWRENFTIGPYS